MIDVVAAVNDEAVLLSNLLRSPMMARADVRFHARRGFRSASRAYGDALVDCSADLVVFAHQDVYLPSGWEQAVRAQIARIERHDKNWAVLGVYGVTAEGRHVGRVWSSGLQQLLGEDFDEPVPVRSIDEVLIVLRRESGVDFDPKMPGYHLFATDLVQSALDRGFGAYVICAPLVHNSRPAAFLRRDYFEAYRYLVRKWNDRLPIRSAVAPVMAPGLRYLALRARHKLLELRQGHRQRVDRGLDCVAIARELEFE